ncbi:MAG TPA: metallophosphoesterase [Candidatus Kapabacteria bacterium]|nr:metallophosphoesterase [Candidatus Kapabacteria bacterium]
MTNAYVPSLFALVATLVLWLGTLLLVWLLNHQWWELVTLKRYRLLTPLAGLAAAAIWSLGILTGVRWISAIGSFAAAGILVLLVALLVALPVSGIILTTARIAQALRRWSERRSAMPSPALSGAGVVALEQEPGSTVSRRSFLTKASAAIPAATLSTAAFGLLSAEGPVRMPEIPLYFPGLHPALDGLRILHISDIHLGNFTGLGTLESLLQDAAERRPDLVLVSGDIADDLAQLPDALRMMAALRPRYGIFATLGNHEYFHDISHVIRIIEAGPIPLLRNTGTIVPVANTQLYIGGADDPVSLSARERNHQFLQKSIAAAFNGAPSDAFHLLMSHRPEGFDVAREMGIAMTVSGHTHGAQLGFNGRSMLEPLMPDRYLWGHYERAGSQLYTSAGVGHWFPFRLGCPAEAPLYVLRRAQA